MGRRTYPPKLSYALWSNNFCELLKQKYTIYSFRKKNEQLLIGIDKFIPIDLVSGLS